MGPWPATADRPAAGPRQGSRSGGGRSAFGGGPGQVPQDVDGPRELLPGRPRMALDLRGRPRRARAAEVLEVLVQRLDRAEDGREAAEELGARSPDRLGELGRAVGDPRAPAVQGAREDGGVLIRGGHAGRRARRRSGWTTGRAVRWIRAAPGAWGGPGVEDGTVVSAGRPLVRPAQAPCCRWAPPPTMRGPGSGRTTGEGAGPVAPPSPRPARAGPRRPACGRRCRGAARPSSW